MDDHRRREIAELDFQQANELIKNRQVFQRRPKKASELISHLLARKGYGQTSAKKELISSWSNAVGSKWRNKTVVGNVRQGVLEVFVHNSTALQELSFQKTKLLRALRTHLPQNNIQDIKFKVGKVNP